MATLKEEPAQTWDYPVQNQGIIAYEGEVNHSQPPRQVGTYGYRDSSPHTTSEVLDGEIVIDAELVTFPGISVSDFLRQTTVYENQPAPIAPRLRQGAMAGMALTVVGSIFLVAASPLQHVISSPPFLLLSGFLRSYLQWVAGMPLLSFVNAALLGAGCVLLVMTRFLRRGRLPMHWLAFAEAIGGSANLLMLAIPLIIVCLNFALWLLILCVVVLVIALVIALL